MFGRGPARQNSRTPVLLTILIRLAINAAALWLAARVVGGIYIEGWRALLAAAAIFGIVNTLIRPVAQIVGLPLTCLTFGLFALVINAAMLALTAWIAGQIDLDVRIDGLWAAFWGALIVGIVSLILIAFVGTPLKWALRPRRRDAEPEP